MIDVAVIGGGPAGLAAAEVAAEAGLRVTVFEAKPSIGRKLLMAGKSGLNLTHAEDLTDFLARYAEAEPFLADAIRAFDNQETVAWATGLGQEMFTGSSGRVFPKSMKASPLLRAWLARLEQNRVRLLTRHRWIGWQGNSLLFDGRPDVSARAVILACGGASWSRLGSDGAWAGFAKVPTRPFLPANAGVAVAWSDFMAPHFASAVKAVQWQAGDYASKGEAIISERGLEGSGIYSVSRGVREGAELTVDLLPHLSTEEVAGRLGKRRGKATLSNHLRKTLNLSIVKRALLREWGHPLPEDPKHLAFLIKNLNVGLRGLRPLDEAISVAGGVPFSALDAGFMVGGRPGVFCAGEMLDWEAPTGGYLLTACLATGRWAGRGAVDYLSKRKTR